jgi:hypothetical protein
MYFLAKTGMFILANLGEIGLDGVGTETWFTEEYWYTVPGTPYLLDIQPGFQ